MATALPIRKKKNYTQLFADCIIKPSKYHERDKLIDQISAAKYHYEAVVNSPTISWQVGNTSELHAGIAGLVISFYQSCFFTTNNYNYQT